MTEPRVALVTAASRGIGAACARELARRGYHLFLLARGDDLDALAAELHAVAVRGSIENQADLRRLVETAVDQAGRIDTVVVNTGHAAKGELLELRDEDWHHGLDLLLLPTVRLARLVTPSMLERGSGAFVNLSSFAAAEPGLRFPISGTLRTSLSAFAKLYAQRYGAAGLRMNNVLPGWVDTHPVDRETVLQLLPGRVAVPEEIAKAVGFLVSDDASYINGQSLLVDGGMVRAL